MAVEYDFRMLFEHQSILIPDIHINVFLFVYIQFTRMQKFLFVLCYRYYHPNPALD